MGGVYSGQVPIYSKVIFLLKLSYELQHLLEERDGFFFLGFLLFHSNS